MKLDSFAHIKVCCCCFFSKIIFVVEFVFFLLLHMLKLLTSADASVNDRSSCEILQVAIKSSQSPLVFVYLLSCSFSVFPLRYRLCNAGDWSSSKCVLCSDPCLGHLLPLQLLHHWAAMGWLWALLEHRSEKGKMNEGGNCYWKQKIIMLCVWSEEKRKYLLGFDVQCCICTCTSSRLSKMTTCHCVSTENCIDYYGENATNITNPNATSPVIEFWE